MDFDLPAVVAEVTAAVQRYETALMDNDVTVLDALFWHDERTIRYGAGENLHGFAAIAGYRRARDASRIARRVERVAVTGLGSDAALASVEFTRLSDGRSGRQSQTWIRTGEGWRIAAAHVSFLPEGR